MQKKQLGLTVGAYIKQARCLFYFFYCMYIYALMTAFCRSFMEQTFSLSTEEDIWLNDKT